MTTRERITQILLWLSVVVWGCMLGGIIYETLVVVPVWTAALPESIGVMTHPSYPIVPSRMWIPFSNVHTLISIAVLIVAWNQRSRRMWLLFAMAVVILSHAMQFGYFWPRNRAMAGPGVSPAEVASMANQWRAVNWFRVGYIAAGFLATLRAFSIPFAGREPSRG